MSSASVETPGRTLAVALAVSLVCSIVVATAAVSLKPLQEANEVRNRQKNILQVVGLLQPGQSVEEQFKLVEPRLIELDTGRFVDHIDVDSFDQREAARDPNLSEALSATEDVARIRRRVRYSTVYLVREDGDLQYVILPVHGMGLWSTLYGFLAFKGDGNTIAGISFYEHAETPGLGDQMDRDDWRAQWPGKLAFGDDATPQIRLAKGRADPDDPHRVDGFAGATLTGNGITNMMQFWLSEQGFGPFLQRLRGGESI